MSAAANVVPRKRLRPLVLHQLIEQVLLVNSPCRLARLRLRAKAGTVHAAVNP